ncbi:hypothetical protein LTR39_005480, partial [Cryomyces antarcticus]
MRQLFDSVVAGIQNMLRVWASGAYSPDFIYEIADSLGVLLWSEFEFGDALYPVNPEFLDNVREEAEYNARRVNYHLFGNSKSISYTPSSTSNGYIVMNFSLPMSIVERYYNLTPGSVYGETGFYNYDSSQAFNFSAYPVGRFSNEFGYHSMPSLQIWQQAIDPSDIYFNSSVIELRNQHYPPGNTNTSNYYNSSK